MIIEESKFTIKFDPLDKHRLSLPPGITCQHSPGSDNYSYEGNRFFFEADKLRTEIFAGDWVLIDVANQKIHIVKSDEVDKYNRIERIRESLKTGVTDPADDIEFLLSYIDELGNKLSAAKSELFESKYLLGWI